MENMSEFYRLFIVDGGLRVVLYGFGGTLLILGILTAVVHFLVRLESWWRNRGENAHSSAAVTPEVIAAISAVVFAEESEFRSQKPSIPIKTGGSRGIVLSAERDSWRLSGRFFQFQRRNLKCW